MQLIYRSLTVGSASPQPQNETVQLLVPHSDHAKTPQLKFATGRTGMFQEMTFDVSGYGLLSTAPSLCLYWHRCGKTCGPVRAFFLLLL